MESLEKSIKSKYKADKITIIHNIINKSPNRKSKTINIKKATSNKILNTLNIQQINTIKTISIPNVSETTNLNNHPQVNKLPSKNEKKELLILPKIRLNIKIIPKEKDIKKIEIPKKEGKILAQKVNKISVEDKKISIKSRSLSPKIKSNIKCEKLNLFIKDLKYIPKTAILQKKLTPLNANKIKTEIDQKIKFEIPKKILKNKDLFVIEENIISNIKNHQYFV